MMISLAPQNSSLYSLSIYLLRVKLLITPPYTLQRVGPDLHQEKQDVSVKSKALHLPFQLLVLNF